MTPPPVAYGSLVPGKPNPDIRHGKRCWLSEGHHACALRRVRRLSRNGLAAAFGKRGSMLAHMADKLTRIQKENARLQAENANLITLVRVRRQRRSA